MLNDIEGEGISIPFLRRRSVYILKKKFNLSPIHISQLNFEYSSNLNKNPIRDVLLFGDGLLILANKYLWAKGKYRFWVLSHSHRQLVEKIFGLHHSQIGLIPRHEIMKESSSISEFPNFSLDTTAIISSRYATDKNIQMTLHLLSSLQHQVEGKLRVAIYSPLGDIEKFRPLIKKNQWKIPPKLFGDGGFEWHKKHKHLRPFFVNLSTSFYEDFNVSLAQSRQMGWPALLSYWAVFREIQTSSIKYIPTNLIIRYGTATSSEVKKRIINKLVSDLLERNSEDETKFTSKDCKLIQPKITTWKELSQFQCSWTDKKTKLLLSTFLNPHLVGNTNLLGQKMVRILSENL